MLPRCLRAREFQPEETITGLTFATKGEANGQIVRKSRAGIDRWRGAGGVDRSCSPFPVTARRPATSVNGILQWLHVFFGITWIGLLYYFNFVQTPTMPKVPAELKPGVSKYIAPSALFYFRWGAAFTVLTGLLLAWSYGELVEALTLQPSARLIGIGMWLALIMAFNVWVIIWPASRRCSDWFRRTTRPRQAQPSAA